MLMLLVAKHKLNGEGEINHSNNREVLHLRLHAHSAVGPTANKKDTVT
jgi:hypothetical protein